MIPPDYVCSKCKAERVKLWRQYQTFANQVELLCAACAEQDQKQKIDLSKHDQCGWLVPAVPTLDGTYWGYTSAPPEGVAWWNALPLKLTGEWPVKGGIHRWMEYREGMKLTAKKPDDHLIRIDNRRSMVLVFIEASA